MKEKGVISEGEQDARVATEQPSVATETQPGGISLVVQSFFRTELRAIKEKQVQQDHKQDKIINQLQNMDELMYFALIMLKRISTSDLADPSIPIAPTAQLALAVQSVST